MLTDFGSRSSASSQPPSARSHDPSVAVGVVPASCECRELKQLVIQLEARPEYSGPIEADVLSATRGRAPRDGGGRERRDEVAGYRRARRSLVEPVESV